ncbi:DNA segregation ATPase FtsK/SpoIIIE, S-DNA-T family [Saccharopolyspora antimicrobica]|uniref:DNA segregation ATPase FtsK/SpoIIIE, S-DNA-T family n=1 Tax=Saccharopolyspora antimicrobica TaxID=455193 RepID=A0A1I4X094_9PSEU|nr:FtsK/SpoIIIE domain-containing protein [Saccharopolyspora antimicrobica]RKT84225.1 S-DNA-T family DNA segregation ATPase FtsK/SpoIIIE [Saccharopolyspora antimicrobica]SFN18893.1 DNA segregation ATPase FtsK/SpoIIIE, S-DNA-T family [Saccharopolyspora antimicrobica]
MDVATEAAELVEALVTMALGTVGWLLRHPATLLVGVVAGVWAYAWGWVSLAIFAGCVLAGGIAWRVLHPVSFEFRVWRHIRAGVLRMWVYELRWPRWARASHLVLFDSDFPEPMIPPIRKVISGPWWDEMHVRMLPGQRQRDYDLAAESLANSRKVERCSVREVSPGVISLGFLRRDPLAKPVALPEITDVNGEDMPLDAVTIGESEHGAPWRVPLLGSHLLGAGMSGSGKGSLLWGIVRQVAPAIQTGRVRLSMIDPKGGMEAEPGKPLYHRYARDDADDILELLTSLVESMTIRKRDLRGVARKLTPTAEMPFELLIIDELAAITKYLGDRKKEAEATRLLGLLLTQGRAPGFAVDAFVQEPTKDVVPMRGLFPYRVALRLDSASQADMILGEGSWQAGAWADRIKRSAPGTAYVVEDGFKEPLRVRAGYTDDPEINRVAREFAAPVNRGDDGT